MAVIGACERCGKQNCRIGGKNIFGKNLCTKCRIKGYIKLYIITLQKTKKPDAEEFKTIVKVSGLGMVIIGLIGFIITMIKQILFP